MKQLVKFYAAALTLITSPIANSASVTIEAHGVIYNVVGAYWDSSTVNSNFTARFTIDSLTPDDPSYAGDPNFSLYHAIGGAHSSEISFGIYTFSSNSAGLQVRSTVQEGYMWFSEYHFNDDELFYIATGLHFNTTSDLLQNDLLPPQQFPLSAYSGPLFTFSANTTPTYDYFSRINAFGFVTGYTIIPETSSIMLTIASLVPCIWRRRAKCTNEEPNKL